MRKLSKKQIREFQNTVLDYYKKEGRRLPWRTTRNPYRILVSEIMLQQTQVSRVLEKYKDFIKKFPNFKALAGATQSDVLRAWQGLGYNRRALALYKTAQLVVKEYNGRLPCEKEKLKTLPGIGEATSASIATFAFNTPTVFIETNIRSVFIHSFFKNKEVVHDKDILPFIEETLPTKNPRVWYYALMDYGVKLKKEGNPNTQSAHYAKQKPFKESDRYIRGKIIKLLNENKKRTLSQLEKNIKKDTVRIKKCLNSLISEGFIKREKTHYFLIN
jgi:A/G-specific adenine glycosylase